MTVGRHLLWIPHVVTDVSKQSKAESRESETGYDIQGSHCQGSQFSLDHLPDLRLQWNFSLESCHHPISFPLQAFPWPLQCVEQEQSNNETCFELLVANLDPILVTSMVSRTSPEVIAECRESGATPEYCQPWLKNYQKNKMMLRTPAVLTCRTKLEGSTEVWRPPGCFFLPGQLTIHHRKVWR